MYFVKIERKTSFLIIDYQQININELSHCVYDENQHNLTRYVRQTTTTTSMYILDDLTLNNGNTEGTT